MIHTNLTENCYLLNLICTFLTILGAAILSSLRKIHIQTMTILATLEYLFSNAPDFSVADGGSKIIESTEKLVLTF